MLLKTIIGILFWIPQIIQCYMNTLQKKPNIYNYYICNPMLISQILISHSLGPGSLIVVKFPDGLGDVMPSLHTLSSDTCCLLAVRQIHRPIKFHNLYSLNQRSLWEFSKVVTLLCRWMTFLINSDAGYSYGPDNGLGDSPGGADSDEGTDLNDH